MILLIAVMGTEYYTALYFSRKTIKFIFLEQNLRERVLKTEISHQRNANYNFYFAAKTNCTANEGASNRQKNPILMLGL